MTLRLRLLSMALLQFAIVICFFLLAMELGQNDSNTQAILSGFLVVLLLLAYVVVRRVQKSVTTQKSERASQAHGEAMSLVAELELAGRREIAAWVHGTLQSSLLNLSRSLLLSGNREASEQITELCDQVVRKKAHEMYPPQLEVSLELALTDLCLDRAELVVSPNLELSALKDFSSVLIPVNIRVAAYRIAEEGLSNALKKPSTTHVRVSVVAESGSLTLSILDDGEAMSVEPKLSLGFRIIEAHVSRCGGSWSISNTNAGVLLKAHLPLIHGTVSTLIPERVRDLARDNDK